MLLGGWLIVGSVRNAVDLLGALIGFLVAAAGGWWLITEHPPRRWVGLAGAVVGLGIVVASLVPAAADTEYP